MSLLIFSGTLIETAFAVVYGIVYPCTACKYYLNVVFSCSALFIHKIIKKKHPVVYCFFMF